MEFHYQHDNVKIVFWSIVLSMKNYWHLQLLN